MDTRSGHRLVGLVLAVVAAGGTAAASAQAGPVTADFAAGMAQVDEAYRSAGGFPAPDVPFSGKIPIPGVPRFAEAFRKLNSLAATGVALDDPVERYKFAVAAARVSCMAGVPADAKRYATLALATFGLIPESRRYPASQEKGAPSATADGFDLGDIIENDGPRFYGRARFGWDTIGDDCSTGVSFRSPTSFTRAGARNRGVRLQCMWARSCTGRLLIRAERHGREGETIFGATLLTGRYSIAQDATRSVPFKLTAAGRRLFARAGRTRAMLIMTSDSPGAGFAGDRRVKRVTLRGESR